MMTTRDNLKPVVLVVDDEAGIRKLLKSMLEKAYRVVTVASTSQALVSIKMHRPDLVVSDIKMPNEDGLGLLKELKSRDPNLPVILMTGNRSRETIIEALKGKAFDYLDKPFGASTLHHVVERALQVSKLEAAKEQLHSQLESSETQMRELAKRLAAVQEDERKRLAREIHDWLGQLLTALNFDVNWIRKKMTPKRKDLVSRLDAMTGLIQDGVEKAQNIVTSLRPSILDNMGLGPAIEWQIQNFSKRSGIKVIFKTVIEQHVSPTISIALFRLVEEGLTNVLQHADANEVTINLCEENEHLILELRDNGKGMSETKMTDPKRLGLIAMRERMMDFVQIQKATNDTIESLNSLIGQVSSTTQQVSYGADQISESSQMLSRGASESASSLEEISASMVQIEAKTKENADNADNAFSLSEKSKSSANVGAEKMNEMVKAMEEIRVSGTNISKIIKVINDIAFQTNLLSLNAAVEAARAGSHGKGFAVVADEVRNLAHRSAKAADETNELIQETIAKVEVGSTIADETSKCLEDIVTGAKEVSDLVGRIKDSSQEQARSTKETTKGLENINTVTQSNSSNSEESATSAEELNSQATQLQELVSKFQLKEKYRLRHKSESKDKIVPEHDDLIFSPHTGTVPKGQNGGPKVDAVPKKNDVSKTDDVSIILDDVNFEDFSKTPV